MLPSGGALAKEASLFNLEKAAKNVGFEVLHQLWGSNLMWEERGEVA
tara:strand:+ start:329 stop:469 length:141 start_codon:yes stop_codon:yes gene_type:complete